MIENLGIASVAAVTVICYLIGMACKAADFVDDRFIPIIVGLSGAVLGVVAYVTKMPEFADFHIVTAIAVGIVSGLAATGWNQVIKQSQKAG